MEYAVYCIPGIQQGRHKTPPDISEKKKELMYDLSQASEGFFVAGLASHLQEEKL